MATILAPRPRIETAHAAPEQAPPGAKPFLTAAWRDFLMLTYEIEPRVLEPLVPRGTELDFWRGRTFVSVVGFEFRDARLFGVKIPFHQHFAEVNLRFYIRRRVGNAWRRGLVFIRELAAKRAVALVARLGYGERFVHVPMTCEIERAANTTAAPRRVNFAWTYRNAPYSLGAEFTAPGQLPEPDSLEEFAVDHYYAYTATRRGDGIEYLVTHDPWPIARADRAHFTGNVWQQYGPRFAPFLQSEPESAFWASGSEVAVYPGKKL